MSDAVDRFVAQALNPFGSSDGATGSLFLEVETWTRQQCQPYTASWMSAVLSLSRYSPQVIQFLLYFAGVRYKEIYLLLFGFGLTGDSLVNFIVNRVAAADARVATCPPVHGALVSFQSQQSAFFVSFALAYAALYRARLKLWHIAALLFFSTAVALADHLLNYHVAPAILNGCLIGATLAVGYQLFLYAIVVPTFPIVLSNSLIAYLAYDDTLTRQKTLTLSQRLVRDFDSQFLGADKVDAARVRTFLALQGD